MARLLRLPQRISSRQFAAAQRRDERGRVRARVAQVARASAPVALGEAVAGGVGEQGVVVIGGRRQIEQRLEQPVDVGAGEEVAAAHDVGDALRGVVDA